MTIRVGDKVRVISGFNKGKEGVLLKKTRDGYVFVSGMKQRKRAKKADNGENFVFLDSQIHISNVKFLARDTGKNDKKLKKKVV